MKSAKRERKYRKRLDIILNFYKKLIQLRKELPVIFLTALDGEEEIVKGFELGADEYITKPFRPRELLSRIRNVIRHTGILEENRQEIQIEHVKNEFRARGGLQEQ